MFMAHIHFAYLILGVDLLYVDVIPKLGKNGFTSRINVLYVNRNDHRVMDRPAEVEVIY